MRKLTIIAVWVAWLLSGVFLMELIDRYNKGPIIDGIQVILATTTFVIAVKVSIKIWNVEL